MDGLWLAIGIVVVVLVLARQWRPKQVTARGVVVVPVERVPLMQLVKGYVVQIVAAAVLWSGGVALEYLIATRQLPISDSNWMIGIGLVFAAVFGPLLGLLVVQWLNPFFPPGYISDKSRKCNFGDVLVGLTVCAGVVAYCIAGWPLAIEPFQHGFGS